MLESIQDSGSFWRRLLIPLLVITLLTASGWLMPSASAQFQDGETVEAVFDDFAGFCTDQAGVGPQVIDTTPGAVEIDASNCADLSIDITATGIEVFSSGGIGFNSSGSTFTISFSGSPISSGFETPVYENTSGSISNPEVSSTTGSSVTFNAWNWQITGGGGDPDGDPERAFFELQGLNEDPVFTSGASSSFSTDEDAGATNLSAQLDVDDSDASQTLTWSVASGPSNGVLSGFPATAMSGTGVQPSGVSYAPNTDYVGSDSFEIEVSDGNGGTDAITVNVTVDNLAPMFSSPATASFVENGTGTVVDNDATNGGDGAADDGVTYSLGGPDVGALSIDPATGTITFASAPDFEAPADSDGNNEYVVEVTADDGESANNTATQTLIITVTDVTADLAIFDGSSAGLDFTGNVTPGTANNPVGIFELSTGPEEAVLDAVSITNDNPGAAGISAARLFASANASLEVGTDTEVGAISVDNTNAPPTFDFTGLSTTLTETATYLILAIDVDAGAPGDQVLFSLADLSALTVIDGAIASVNGQSQTTFGALPLANASTALPVELVAFEARPNDGAVELRWVTTSETGNAGFDVQRRAGTDTWATLTPRVLGAGTTAEQQTYRFTDDTLPYDATSAEYRLRQIDVDGGEAFSATRTVDFSAPDQIELRGTAPNPAQFQTSVQYAVPPGVSDAQLVLYDMLGRKVRSVPIRSTGRQTATLSTTDLAPGMYFLRLSGGGEVRTTKISVVR